MKRSLGNVYNTSRKILSVADRAHAIVAQNFDMVQDRFDPETRNTIGTALQTYGIQRKRIKTIDESLQNLGSQARQSFPEYL